MSMQALPALPETLSIIEMGGPGGKAAERPAEGAAEEGAAAMGGLFLLIGLQNGVLLRTGLDAVTGDLSDTRTRYLGSRAVKLFRINVQSKEAVCPIVAILKLY